jgi:hypothetical protein
MLTSAQAELALDRRCRRHRADLDVLQAHWQFAPDEVAKRQKQATHLCGRMSRVGVAHVEEQEVTR